MNTQVAATTEPLSASIVMEEFRAGVTAILLSWSALRAAVESGWGGRETNAKAEDLRDNIYRVMDFSCYPPKMTIDELEDNLSDYLEQEFSVILEDNSERQVADMLWRMYEECYQGNATLARQMVASAESASQVAKAFPVQVQKPEEDDDDDDDDEDVQMMATDDAAASGPSAAQLYSSGSLFGGPAKPAAPPKPVRQLGEAAPEKPAAEVDDDGFATVPTRRRKGKST